MPGIFVLSTHLQYACRHSGACCEAGWDIPIDERRAAAVDTAIDTTQLAAPGLADSSGKHRTGWLMPAKSLPAGDVGVLARTPAGACVFRDLDERRCAIQKACGHDALPIACQQFPRIVLADDRGLHVALSHFCPTAASLLVDAPAPPTIVEAPDGRVASGIVDINLDARGHWPPLLRPGVLMSLEAWRDWEHFAVATLGAGNDPLVSLARVRRAAERLITWYPNLGALEDCLRSAVERAVCESVSPEPLSWEGATACWREAWGAVATERTLPPELPPIAGRDESWVLEAIEQHAGPIGRYLAARSFASWMAYQGHGLRSFVASLRTALGVLVVEMPRAAGGSHVHRDDVRLAVRRTDQLLVHLAEAAALARTWNRAEVVCNLRRFRESSSGFAVTGDGASETKR